MKTIAKSLALACVLTAGLAAPSALLAQAPTERASYTIPHVLDTVGKLASQPMPAGLSAEDQRAYAVQTEWLKSVQSRLQALNARVAADARAAEASVASPRDSASGLATGKRQHKPMMIQPEIDSLRGTVEAEAKKFSAVSNVLKTRHDMAMNAIRNLKG